MAARLPSPEPSPSCRPEPPARLPVRPTGSRWRPVPAKFLVRADEPGSPVRPAGSRRHLVPAKVLIRPDRARVSRSSRRGVTDRRAAQTAPLARRAERLVHPGRRSAAFLLPVLRAGDRPGRRPNAAALTTGLHTESGLPLETAPGRRRADGPAGRPALRTRCNAGGIGEHRGSRARSRPGARADALQRRRHCTVSRRPATGLRPRIGWLIDVPPPLTPPSASPRANRPLPDRHPGRRSDALAGRRCRALAEICDTLPPSAGASRRPGPAVPVRDLVFFAGSRRGARTGVAHGRAVAVGEVIGRASLIRIRIW